MLVKGGPDESYPYDIHDSTDVVACAKICSDHIIRIWIRAKFDFDLIWITMENLLVKLSRDHYENTKKLVHLYQQQCFLSPRVSD